MTWVVRAMAALVATIVAALCPASPASANDLETGSGAATYTYDSVVVNAVSWSVMLERGPPARAVAPTLVLLLDLTVGHRSSGDSTHAETTYDTPASFVSIDSTTISAGAPAASTRAETTGSRWVRVSTPGAGFAAKGATGAESALSGSLLNRHLGLLESYGSAGFKQLESGRFRYYGAIKPASKPGDMVGRRLVREWDPATDAMRTWHETIDQAGRVRIVRPQTGPSKTHYYFDEFGNYGGSW